MKLGKLWCAVIRRMGGKHKWISVYGNPSPMRIQCVRCGRAKPKRKAA
jgi:hypothetical protein